MGGGRANIRNTPSDILCKQRTMRTTNGPWKIVLAPWSTVFSAGPVCQRPRSLPLTLSANMPKHILLLVQRSAIWSTAHRFLGPRPACHRSGSPLGHSLQIYQDTDCEWSMAWSMALGSWSIVFYVQRQCATSRDHSL